MAKTIFDMYGFPLPNTPAFRGVAQHGLSARTGMLYVKEYVDIFKFVTVGNVGTFSTSIDGVTWTDSDSIPNQTSYWRSVCYANGKFVVVGAGGKFSTSKDGVTWTSAVAIPNQTGFWQSVCYADGKFVVVGAGGKFSTSEDGVTWTEAAAITGMSLYTWWSVCYADGKFVAVGEGGKFSTSEDGVTWKKATAITGSADLRYVCYVNCKVMTVGGYGRIFISEDGTNWLKVASVTGQTGSWCSVCYANGKFVVVGDNGKFSTSEDGVTWTSAVAIPNQTGFWQSVYYANGKFVVVGAGGKFSTSEDGVTWTESAVIPNQKYDLSSVCCKTTRILIPTTLSEIPRALASVGSIEKSKELLVGKEFDDVWVNYDATGAGDATPASVDGHPAYLDPLVVTNVEEVEDADGNKHLGAVLLRKYATRYKVVFDAANTEEATERTAQNGIYYYGLSLGATSIDYTNLTLLALSDGDDIPYDEYEKVYRNSVKNKTRRIVKYGHNRYETSAIRQYLNSSGGKGEWWVQKHVGQTAPSNLGTISGYKRGCSSTLLSLVKPVKRTVFANTICDSDGQYTVCDEFFLPSCAELFGSSNPNEGNSQAKYWTGLVGYAADPSDDEDSVNGVRCTCPVNGKSSETTYRTRSAVTNSSGYVYRVSASGSITTGTPYASTSINSRVACVIY